MMAARLALGPGGEEGAMRGFAGLVGLVVLAGCAAPVVAPTDATPPLEVSEVIAVEGKSSQDLCNAARDWTATAFRDSKAVVEVFDPVRGRLIGKGNMAVPIVYGMTIPVHFTMTIDCKDGRIRAVFTNYETSYGGARSPIIDDGRNQVKTKAAGLTNVMIAELRQHLVAKPKNDF